MIQSYRKYRTFPPVCKHTRCKLPPRHLVDGMEKVAEERLVEVSEFGEIVNVYVREKEGVSDRGAVITHSLDQYSDRLEEVK